jgi:hypothetical protein
MDFFVNNWALIATAFGFLIAVLVKTAFDFHFGLWIVRLFYWVPVRWLFQEKIPNLHGSWSHIWHHVGSTHKDDELHHDNSALYQLGRYVCCKHYADGVLYEFFGIIRGGFISGIWFDPKSPLGYSGAFHLRIVSEKSLRGHWIGHSVHSHPSEIQGNTWIWTKNSK